MTIQKTDKRALEEWEIRLNSNIIFLREYLANHSDFIVTTEPENGDRDYTLAEIVDDLEDIREDIELSIKE